MIDDRTILITGGTGSLGHALTEHLLLKHRPKKIIIYSRDEYKQFMMRQKFKEHSKILRFFVGDVRDLTRIHRAFAGVDYVIHTAALKQVPSCEYNPIEAVKTNIDGAENIINAAIDSGVKKVIALSTDKAVNPVNLYGATKLVSDKLFLNGNAYSGKNGTIFSVVRYGNVSGSRGSVIPYFQELLANGEKELPVTDERMTRFWIYLREGVELVMNALQYSHGGEIFVSKLPAYRVTDLVKALDSTAKINIVGIRPGEKLHEMLLSDSETRTALEYEDFFVVYPEFKWHEGQDYVIPKGKPIPEDFVYTSDQVRQLTVKELQENLIRLKDVEIHL